MFVERDVFFVVCKNLQVRFYVVQMNLLSSNVVLKVCLFEVSQRKSAQKVQENCRDEVMDFDAVFLWEMLHP